MGIGRALVLWTWISGIAGALWLIDYIGGSRVAHALGVPLSIPTGIVLILVAVLCALFLFARSDVPGLRLRLETCNEKMRHLQTRVDGLSVRNAQLEQQLADADAKLVAQGSMTGRVLAILAAKDQDAHDILRSLYMDPHDAENMRSLMDALGVLVKEGSVVRGSLEGWYRIAPKS